MSLPRWHYRKHLICGGAAENWLMDSITEKGWNDNSWFIYRISANKNLNPMSIDFAEIVYT